MQYSIYIYTYIILIYIVYLYIYTIILYTSIYTPEFNYLSSLSLSFVSRCFRDVFWAFRYSLSLMVPRWSEIHMGNFMILPSPGWSQRTVLGEANLAHVAMDQYLWKIPFLMGWTSINPSYFDVNYRGTRFWHTAMFFSSFVESSWKKHIRSPFWKNIWVCLEMAHPKKTNMHKLAISW
jgi:hypothetical protein